MSFLGGPLEIGLSALFENKPDVPAFHWTDLLQQQMDTAQGNLDALGLNEQFGSKANDFMRSERAKTLAGTPGGSALESQTAGDLESWLRGEISPDVSSAVSRASNARAVAGGYGGSGMGRNLQARDLGLTSLDLQRSAVPLAGTYLSGAAARRAIPEFNPASMSINPLQAANFNAAQSAGKWGTDWLKNQVAAQPEPWQSSLMSSARSGGEFLDAYGAKTAGGAAGAGGSALAGML